MAKRFSETTKWSDEWFSCLKPIEKLVFLFLIDNCDNAGIIEVNARLNSFLIGISDADYLGAIKGLNAKIEISKDGKKIWIKNFLLHQKNLPLNIENNAHKQIILLLEMNQNNFTYSMRDLGANQGLISPIGKGKGKDIGKSIDKVNEKSNDEKSDYEKFYLSQISENESKELIENYKALYSFLCENDAKHVFRIKKQLTYQEYETLKIKEAKSGVSLTDKIKALVNDTGYAKGKQSVYLTLNNWMNRDAK